MMFDDQPDHNRDIHTHVNTHIENDEQESHLLIASVIFVVSSAGHIFVFLHGKKYNIYINYTFWK